MKISIQVIGGVVAGLLLALLLPEGNLILNTIIQVSAIIISIGRYIILPLMLFSMIVSVYQLYRSKLLLKQILKLSGLSAAFAFALVLVGMVTSLIFSPGQIPVVIDGIQTINVPTLLDLVKVSFPDNIFTLFIGDFSNSTNQFVPFFVLALIIGIFFNKSSKEEIEPSYNLFDSLSRIFYRINKFFTKTAILWTTIIVTTYVVVLKGILDLEIFLPLIIMLSILTAVIIFIIYPIIYYYTCGKKNSFKYILVELPNIFNAIITGDQFYTNTSIISTHKESFQVKRDRSGFNLPFLTLFSKGGTALVTVISFIVILKSYSSLEITVTQILWVGIMSFLISFCLPTKAVGSSVASLFLLCSMYGYGGMEDSFIILSPIFPVLATVTTVINTGTISLISLIMDPDKDEIIL